MNAIYFNQRLSARILAAVALLSLVASLVPMQAFATDLEKPIKCANGFHLEGETCVADPVVADDLNPNVDICHATKSDNNPYSDGKQEVDANSIITGGNGHDGHNDGGLDDLGDIIPPFEYGAANDLSSYPGKNWAHVFSNGKTGQQIAEDDECEVSPLTVDVCSNIDSDQANVPEGHYADDGECFPNPEEEVVTIVATKIVCTNEADLPNWGAGGPNITSTTASEWVAAHESCSLAEGWDFEWALDSNDTDPGDTLTGPAGAPWTTFGETDDSGEATLTLTEDQLDGNTMVWFREVLKPGYLAFSHDTTNSDVTAEFYCETDALNYDNYDWINNIEVDNTYNCVAWNVPLEVDEPEMCTVTIVSDTSDFVVEKSANALALSFIHGAWNAVITGATWIWGDNPVVNPVADETQTFKKQFGFVGNVTNATLYVASDNSHTATLNGDAAGTATDEQNFALAGPAAQDQYAVTGLVDQGNNELVVAVKNWAGSANPQNNPAGLLYKLVIEGEVTSDKDCVTPYVPPVEDDTTITFHKVTNIESGQGFNFSIDDSETAIGPLMGGQSSAPIVVTPGNHYLDEGYVEGWTLTEIVCINEDENPAGTTENDSYEVYLEAGDDVTCTFYNTKNVVVPPICESGQNLLVNGSFEEDHGLSDGQWGIFNPVLPWAISNDGLEIWHNLFGLASDGDQNVELDGNSPSTITQTVATIPGATYELSFDFSARPGTPLTDNNVDARADGDLLVNVSADGTALGANTWNSYSQTFVADADASTDISFNDNGVSNSLGSLIDNAVLCLVEEPAPMYTLDGYKFNDENGDGEWDEGEYGIEGWTINLLDDENVVVSSITTDEYGYYSFSVVAGSYEVEEVNQSGWEQTAPSDPNTCEFTVGGLQQQTIPYRLLTLIDIPQNRCDFGNHPVVPPVCSVNVVSDTSNMVNDSGALVVTDQPTPPWVSGIVDSLAQWIWGSPSDAVISGDVDESQTFVKSFEWNGPVTGATLKLATDNMYSVTLNGTVVATSLDGDNFSSIDTIINIADDVIQGTNTLEITVTNDANGATSLNSENGNPAGLLYDLTVLGDSEADCTDVPDGGGDEDGLSCTISASDTDIQTNDDVTITWSSSIEAVSADITNIGTGLATTGSQFIENLDDDTTYTMTVYGDYIGDTEVREQDTCSVTVNTHSGGGGGGGGTRVDRDGDNGPDGDVLGASDSAPTGDVLGAQVSAVPAGAPNTGKGGTATVVLGQFLALPRRRNA